MKSIIITLLLFSKFSTFSQRLYHGTCIIAKIHGDSIFIGADSRRSLTEYKDGKLISEKFVEVCKIHEENGYYYSSSGQAPHIASFQLKQCFAKAKNIADLVNKINSTVRLTVQATFDSLRISGSEVFSKWLDDYPFNIVIGYYEYHKPNLIGLGFHLLPNSQKATFEIVTIKKDMIPAGEYGRIWNELNSQSTWEEDNIVVIKNLILKVEKLVPQNVAGPIDIIKIWEHGHKWISKKKSCSL